MRAIFDKKKRGTEEEVGSIGANEEEGDNIDRRVLKGLNIISALLPGLNSVFAKKAICKPKCKKVASL